MKNLKTKLFFTIIIYLNITTYTLDTTFGQSSNGIITLAINSEAQINNIKIQNDGKIITGGYSITNNSGSQFTLARFNINGTPDPTFGQSGIQITSISSSSQIMDLEIQNDEKIIACGYSNNGANQFTLARYNTDGSIDNSFGTNGIALTSIGDSASAQAAKIQSDGKIIAAGSTVIDGFSNFALVRYNTDGSLDNSFNNNGIVTTLVGQRCAISSISIQSDEKIVVGGFTTDTNFTEQFTVARYNTDGSIDTTFGNNGVVITTVGDISHISAISIQADGKIIAAGFTGSTSQFLLARYNADGSLDTIFGTNGIVSTIIGDFSGAASIQVQSDNKIIASGFSNSNGTDQFVTIRYNTDGTIDETFGTNGIMINTIGFGSRSNSSIIQSDGKIVSGGYAQIGSNYQIEFCLARYSPNNTDSIDILYPLATSTITNTKRPIIYGSSSITGSQYELLVNGTSWLTGTTDYQGNWNAGPTNILTNGQNSIQANLIQNSGIIASNINQFTINASDFIMIYPANGSTVTTSTPNIYGISSVANAQVMILLDSQFFALADTDSVGDWDAGPTSSLTNGNHVIIIMLINQYGNTLAAGSSKFTVNV